MLTRSATTISDKKKCRLKDNSESPSSGSIVPGRPDVADFRPHILANGIVQRDPSFRRA
jgi:hypothetical protein